MTPKYIVHFGSAFSLVHRPPHPYTTVQYTFPNARQGRKDSCWSGCQIVAVRSEGGRKHLPIGLPDYGSPPGSLELAAAMEIAAASTRAATREDGGEHESAGCATGNDGKA